MPTKVVKVKSGVKQGKKGNGKKSGAVSKKSNQPLATVVRSVVRQQPVQRMLPNGDVVVTHRELLGPVVGQGATFALSNTLQINPGNTACFPWLAGVSQQYESYVFSSLMFEYKPMVPATFPGAIYITADFDGRDAPPLTQATASVTPGSTQGPIHAPLSMRMRPADLLKRKTYFVRTVGDGGYSGGTDVRSFDTGNLFVYVDSAANAAGTPLTTTIGQLWVSYTVRLMTPQYGNTALTGLYMQRTLPVADPGTSIKQGSLASSIAGTINKLDNNLVDAFKFDGSAPSVASYSGPVMALAKWVGKGGTGSANNFKSGFINFIHNGAFMQPGAFDSTGPTSTSRTMHAVSVLDLKPKDTLDVVYNYQYGASPGPLTSELDVIFQAINPSTATQFASLLSPLAIANLSPYGCHMTSAGAMTAASPLGVPVEKGNTTLFPYNSTTGVLSFPPGQWVLTYHGYGTTLVVPASFTPSASTIHSQSVTFSAGADEWDSYVHFSNVAASTIDLSITSAASIGGAVLWLLKTHECQDSATAILE